MINGSSQRRSSKVSTTFVRKKSTRRGTKQVARKQSDAHINDMHRVCVLLGQTTLDMTDEIAAALESSDGTQVTRSHVIRLAIATLRKRMADEGMLEDTANG